MLEYKKWAAKKERKDAKNQQAKAEDKQEKKEEANGRRARATTPDGDADSCDEDSREDQDAAHFASPRVACSAAPNKSLPTPTVVLFVSGTGPSMRNASEVTSVPDTGCTISCLKLRLAKKMRLKMRKTNIAFCLYLSVY